MSVFSCYAQWVSPVALPPAPTPMFELRANATSAPCILSVALKSMMFISGGDVQHTLGIARDAQTGIPLDAGVFPAAREDAGGVSNNALVGLSVITRWSKNPATPSVYLRRKSGNFVSGPSNLFTWKFSRGISLAPNNSLIIWAVSYNQQFLTPSYELSEIEIDV